MLCLPEEELQDIQLSDDFTGKWTGWLKTETPVAISLCTLWGSCGKLSAVYLRYGQTAAYALMGSGEFQSIL